MNNWGVILLACLVTLATAQVEEVTEAALPLGDAALAVSTCPGANQVYSTCIDACRDDCTTIGRKLECRFIACNEGCDCRNGYVWSTNDVGSRECILVEECEDPQCWRPNEYFSLCVRDQTCEGYFDSGSTRPPRSTEGCVAGCRCRSGYIKGESNRCVRPRECCTDENSELVRCANQCPGGTCAFPEFQNCFIRCRPRGCQCIWGFLKTSASNATCIPEEDCPET